MAVFDLFSEEKRRENATYRPACFTAGKNDLFPNFLLHFLHVFVFLPFLFLRFCVFAVFASFCILDRPQWYYSAKSIQRDTLTELQCPALDGAIILEPILL